LEPLRPQTTYGAVLGRVLALQRQICQLEQADVAARLGLAQSTWSRFETGESALTVDQLSLVANVLRTSAPEILGRVDQATAALTQKGVIVHRGNVRDFAKQGLALIGAVALGALVVAALTRK
jgi:transcriptional regulator with XRE-family HTH domain